MTIREIVPHNCIEKIVFCTNGQGKTVQPVDIPWIDGGDILEVAGEAARLLGGVAYPVEARTFQGRGRKSEIHGIPPVNEHLRQLEVRYPSVGVVVAHFTVTGEHALTHCNGLFRQ